MEGNDPTGTDQDPGLIEGFDDVEDAGAYGHASGPWTGEEMAELEQLAEVVPEDEGGG